MMSINSPFQYLFEASCCLIVFYLFYHWVLRKETFFQLNRFYLLLTPVFSLFIPSLQLKKIETASAQTPVNFEFIPEAINVFQQTEVDFSEKVSSSIIANGLTWGDLVLSLYISITILFLIIFLRKLLAIRKIIKTHNVEKKANYYLVILPTLKTPFSFLNYLFWNGSLEKESQLMLQHEQVHIRQNHSIDIIFMELLVIFFWFHPLVYLFRNAIKMTHEYLADQQITQEVGRRKEYAALLLSKAIQSSPSIASTFHSFIKNRLEMIYKTRTPRKKLVHLCSLLPLITMLTVLFSCDQVNSISNDPVGKIIDHAEVASEDFLNKEIFADQNNLKNGRDITKQEFDVNFRLDELKGDKYSLSVSLQFENEAFVISPFSQDSVYGHLSLTIPPSENLVINKSLTEIPPSIPEIDPIINQPVRFVKDHTTYQKALKVISQNDFKVSGVVEFVLEPICVPYDVHFTIIQKDGKMKVEKTSSIISSEYKF